jgi:hypothetical protein
MKWLNDLWDWAATPRDYVRQHQPAPQPPQFATPNSNPESLHTVGETSARFDHFIPWILLWETEFKKGHYGDWDYVRVEHDPDDPGGATKYGIDQRSHPHVDIENLTKPGAIHLYWLEWVSAGIEAMPAKYGEVYFNCHVNAGPGRANALRKEEPTDAGRYIAAQAAWYNRLAKAKPVDEKDLQGWLNRLVDEKKFLKI